MEQFFYTETMTVMNADADFRSLLKPSNFRTLLYCHEWHCNTKSKNNIYYREITKPSVAMLQKETDFSKILALSLFVSRIFADYSYSSFSFDDLAFFANRFY